MNTGRTVFAQIMEFVPWTSVARIVDSYHGNLRVRSFPCSEQFRVMALAQLTWRESLRDIEVALETHRNKLYALGFRAAVRRSTLADANESRDYRIWADVAALLIRRARRLYQHEPLGIELDNTVYALDSSTIDLCLSLFPWAPFQRTKGAVKLHTLLDLRGSIPAFLHISDGKMHDVNTLDLLVPEPGAFYVMDRAYLDYTRLFTLHQAGAFFVTRAKSSTGGHRVYSMPVERDTGVISDQRIRFDGYYSSRKYPELLRRIRFRDPDTNAELVFLTNNTRLPALAICALYKSRWQIELFFKWIKQHLRIRHFLGNSENAVKTQIWCAIATYVLIAIIRKQLVLNISLYTCLQVLSVSVFERTRLASALAMDPDSSLIHRDPNQLMLF